MHYIMYTYWQYCCSFIQVNLRQSREDSLDQISSILLLSVAKCCQVEQGFEYNNFDTVKAKGGLRDWEACRQACRTTSEGYNASDGRFFTWHNEVQTNKNVCYCQRYKVIHIGEPYDFCYFFTPLNLIHYCRSIWNVLCVCCVCINRSNSGRRENAAAVSGPIWCKYPLVELLIFHESNFISRSNKIWNIYLSFRQEGQDLTDPKRWSIPGGKCVSL